MRKKLTKKQKAFADAYLEKGNATEAVIDAKYKVKDRKSAGAIGGENLQKLNIKEYLEDKAETAVTVIFQLCQSAENETVKLNASKDILDRAGYKPVDRSESTVKMEMINDNEVTNLAEQLDAIHKRTNLGCNGVETNSVYTEIQDKE